MVNELADNNVSVAFDVTGIADTISGTARLVRAMPWVPPYPPSPKLVILGSYTDPIVLDYDPLFMDEVDIVFSRDTRPDDISDMLKLLAENKVNPDLLDARIFAADEAPTAYQEMIQQKLMRVQFKW